VDRKEWLRKRKGQEGLRTRDERDQRRGAEQRKGISEGIREVELRWRGEAGQRDETGYR